MPPLKQIICSFSLLAAVCFASNLWTKLLPEPENEELRDALALISYPEASNSLQEVQQLFVLLNRTMQTYPDYVHLTFSSAYVSRLAWPVSGIDYMNILAGALYGKWFGLILCTMLTTVGSGLAYWIVRCSMWCHTERMITQRSIQLKSPKSNFPSLPSSLTFSAIRARIENNWNGYGAYWFGRRLSLKLFFLTGLIMIRLFPFMPWFVLNYTLAFLEVPVCDFLVSTFIGCIPYTQFCLVVGSHLMTLQPTDSDLYLFIFSSIWAVIVVIVFWLLNRASTLVELQFVV